MEVIVNMAHRSIPKSLAFLLIFCLLLCCQASAASPTTSIGSTSAISQTATSVTTVNSSGASPGAGSGPGIAGGLPPGFYWQPYSATLQSSFGEAPYAYALVGGGLPPGVILNSAGNITGTPVDTGSFNFQVKATDSSKPPVSKTSSYSLNIAIGLDTYGGLTATRANKPATAYFRLEKQNGRWKLVSPLGNNLYLFSIFNANESFLESWVIPKRYNGNAELWAAHRGERMLSWGFNTLGEYTCFRGLPVGTWGSKDGNPVKLPFIFFMSGAADALYHPSDIGIAEPIKQIINGIPPSTYNCSRNYCGVGVLDVFDPKWAQAYAGEVAMNQKIFTGGFANTPWMIGITTEDADYFWPLIELCII